MPVSIIIVGIGDEDFEGRSSACPEFVYELHYLSYFSIAE